MDAEKTFTLCELYFRRKLRTGFFCVLFIKKLLTIKENP